MSNLIEQLDEAAKRQLALVPDKIPHCLEYIAARHIEQLARAVYDLLDVCETNFAYDKRMKSARAVLNKTWEVK